MPNSWTKQFLKFMGDPNNKKQMNHYLKDVSYKAEH